MDGGSRRLDHVNRLTRRSQFTSTPQESSVVKMPTLAMLKSYALFDVNRNRDV